MDPERPASDEGAAGAAATDALHRLRCPRCGYVGETPPAFGGEDPFRYLADVTCYRSILRSGGSSLVVAAEREEYAGDLEKNERLECRDCGHEFPIPDYWEVTFVELPQSGLSEKPHVELG